MAQRLGSQSITVNTTQIFSAPSMGIKGLVIDNASPYVLNVRLEGSAINKTLQPAGTDFFPVTNGFNGNVVYSSQSQVTNPQSYTNYTLTIDAIGLTENIDVSQYPIARPQAAVSPTATGQPIFSATVGFGSTSTNEQHLCVYNPQNSGVSYQFHSARFFCSSPGSGSAAWLNFNSGADLNFSTPIPTISHDCGTTPPISQSHATAQDSAVFSLGTIVEVFDATASTTLDFLSFPDQVILRPGNNLRISMVGANAAAVVRLTLKWTEVPQIVQTGTGGATTGNILTAANIINNGNGVGTGIISAQPSGDTNNAVFLDNAGNFTLGDALHLGALNINGPNLSAAVLSNLAAGDWSIISGLNEIFRMMADGSAKIACKFQSFNGATGGTLLFYEILTGSNFKMCFLIKNNWNSPVATNQNVVLAHPFAGVVQFETGAIGNSSLFLKAGGSNMFVNIVTALAFAGGTLTGSSASAFGGASSGTANGALDTIEVLGLGSANFGAALFWGQ